MAGQIIIGTTLSRPDGPLWALRRRLIPSSLTVITLSELFIFYLEATNNTGGSLSLTVFDSDGLIVIPGQIITNGGILTYKSEYGTPMKGLKWQASGVGLVGWFSGVWA